VGTVPGMDVRPEDTLHHATTVAAPVERAFATFSDGLAGWWPREYTWAQDTLETIAIEPREGGRCFERGPHGFHCDWGRVLAWDPPDRLVFTWQIGPDRVPEPNPAKASEVEVRFVADGPSATRVELEHRGFSRHGDGGDRYRAAMGSRLGWPLILDRYAAAA
jgi:uncharacterized protein YndB with AHSA1/START domain